MNISRKIHNLLYPKIGEIWMLHRVVEHRSTKPEQRVLEVTPEWLEQKILEYQRKGYSFISIDNIFNFHFSFFNSHRWVCITLDDGYRDNYTLAYPLFKRMSIPFVVYVTTGFIDNQREMWWYPGEQLGIGCDELKKMAADSLCTIGAHTVSHPKLATIPSKIQRQEIEQSKLQLGSLLGTPIAHFSFPHGSYNSDTLEICRSLGFKTAVTTNGRTVRTDYDPLQLDRINIVQNDE